MIYIVVFIFSTLMFYLAQHEGKKINHLLIFLGILSLSLLAGLRDETIGTDVLYYGKSVFQAAQRFESFKDVSQLASLYSMEYGYIVLNWLVAKIFNNFQMLLFIISLITITFTYKAIDIVPYKNKWEIMLLFDLIYFNLSLNVLRQSIAMAIVLYSVAQVVINNKNMYGLLIIPAILFHKSAVVCIGIYLIYYIYNKRKGTKWRFFFYALIILLQFSLSFALVRISSRGILPSKYETYLIMTIAQSKDIGFFDIIFKISPVLSLLFLLVLVRKMKIYEENVKLEVFIVISLITVSFGILYYGVYIQRVVWYADYVTFLIGIPMIYTEIKNIKGFSSVRFMTIIMLLIYWINNIVIKGYNETYPYIPFWK